MLRLRRELGLAGLSTRTTSALIPSRTPSWISLAIVSPPAVPGPAVPSTMSPAMVTIPIGPLGFLSTASATSSRSPASGSCAFQKFTTFSM